MSHQLSLESALRMKALAHPLRLRVLTALGVGTMTNQQIAAALEQPPSRVHFHVRTLAKAGLLEIVELRPKRGVTEKYYRARAGSYQLGNRIAPGSPAGGEIHEAVLDAARAEYAQAAAASDGTVRSLAMGQEKRTLSDQAVRRVTSHLRAISKEFALAEPPPRGDGTPYVFTFVLHETGETLGKNPRDGHGN